MKLFYSIISQENQPQQDPLMSLGGFCSSTQVSSSLNSLFGNISEKTLEDQKPQYVCLILKNTFSVEIKDITLWIENALTNQGKYRVAICESIGSEFESTQSIYSKPLYAEFNTVDGQSDSISIPDMQPQKKYALWIERSINSESEEVKGRKDCDYLYSKLGEELETLEKLSLKINWTNG